MHIHTIADRSLARARCSPLAARLRRERVPADSAAELAAAVLMLLVFMAAAILV